MKSYNILWVLIRIYDTWAATLASGHAGKSGFHVEEDRQSAPGANEPVSATRIEPRTVPLAQANGASLKLHAGAGVGANATSWPRAAAKTQVTRLIIWRAEVQGAFFFRFSFLWLTRRPLCTTRRDLIKYCTGTEMRTTLLVIHYGSFKPKHPLGGLISSCFEFG